MKAMFNPIWRRDRHPAPLFPIEKLDEDGFKKIPHPPKTGQECGAPLEALCFLDQPAAGVEGPGVVLPRCGVLGCTWQVECRAAKKRIGRAFEFS